MFWVKMAAGIFEQGAVYALGNFDGVHNGHQALLAAAKSMAQPLGLPTVAMTFSPHPRRFFAPHLPPFQLTDSAQKDALLRQAGADAVLVLPFGADLAAMRAEDFVHKILLERCHARGIVAGEDFRFGHDRAGDMARLADWVEPEHISVLPLSPVRDAQGQRYAASTIRTLLQAGQVRAAAALLGRDWGLRGMVAHGDKRGRTLGFPTANFALGDYQRPLYGVYAARGRRLADGSTLDGVANIGRRPTVDGSREWLEVHFFDFSDEIYDEAWEISLHELIRPEQRFNGVDQLIGAIRQDCATARKMLSRT